MKLFEFDTEITIEKLRNNDVKKALLVGSACFPTISKDYFIDLVKEELNNDFSISYVAKDNGKIIGGYFLGRQQLYDEKYPATYNYKNKKGIHGECLFLLPEYRNTGIGKRLRDIPLKLGYDYIWGENHISLNNIDKWLKFGRKYIMTVDDVHYTVMEL